MDGSKGRMTEAVVFKEGRSEELVGWEGIALEAPDEGDDEEEGTDADDET